MFKPRQDYILVKPLPRPIPSVIQVVNWEKHCRGEVMAVGPGKRDAKGRLQPLDAKVGDIVAFGDGTRSLDMCYPEFREAPESEPYRIIQEADICFIEQNGKDVEYVAENVAHHPV